MNKIRKSRLFIFLPALAVLAGLFFWFWYSRHSKPSAAELVIYGNVDIRQVELAFNDKERITEMLVQEGDRVRKGQLLASLDARRLEYAVQRAKGRVQAQTEVVARLEAGTREEEIRKARADVAAAQAEADIAARTSRRLAELVDTNAVSRQKVDEAQASAEAAAARLKAAREGLALALAGPRAEDIAAAKATLAAYEAELALAQQELADAKLYAPAGGVIQDRILEPGDMASPEKAVYTLALTDRLWVRAYLSEPDLGKVRLGMRAEVKTDSYPDKRYRAWIGFISPTAEFSPKSVETAEVRTSLVNQVRVHVCNPRGELRLGMPATVIIPLNQPAPGKNPASGPCDGP